MREIWKTTRVALTIVIVMAAGMWTGVTFLGESWSSQGRYVLTLLILLLMIVLSAALLVLVGKALGILWDKLVSRMSKQQSDQEPDNSQQ